ncbi:hypothetical protein Tsubulata_029946 [Turnera subulata]|uniref:F-box domain-containing protein n=1 Tax=Turnera subulata TaxID=218843 RepID=A0A9Q0J255_9ROSI|nr:hypothetical protein Tsubulata_029946 [Turnera subulata]
MEAINSSCLPPEIEEEILALLPFKSIHRFKSLSKSWFSLLTIKLKVPKLLCCRRKAKSSNPNTISSDDQVVFDAVVLPDYGCDVKNTVYMSPELSLELSLLSGSFWFAFVGSCNGLVCLQCLNKLEIFVLNPSTSICRKLPRAPLSLEIWHYYAYGFGYDSASDDYKVFLAGKYGANVEIFSLKTGSWRKVENHDRRIFQNSQCLGSMGLLLNGALHWGPGKSTWGENVKIIAFDLDKEKFYHVPSPPSQSPLSNRANYSLGVVGEYLLCLFKNWERNIVWVMKEYCNEASWVPFISYTSSKDGKHHSLTYVCDFIPRSFKDGRYMLLQFSQEHIHHVLIRWNNILEESDEAEKYSKKVEISKYLRATAIAYTETLSSPYAS